MAKYRRRSKDTRRSSTNNNSNNENTKISLDNPEAERALEHSGLPSKDHSNTLPDALDEVAQGDNFEFPFLLTDDNKRTWFFNKGSSAVVEYSRRPRGPSSYLPHFVLANTVSRLNQHILEDFVSDRDSHEQDLDWEFQTPGPGQRAENAVRSKRQPSSVDSSPTKRRKGLSSAKGGEMSQSVRNDANGIEIDGDESEGEEDEVAIVTFESRSVRVDGLHGTMVDILKKLQQKGLKQFLKAILKKCHPQKQANFPYNGGKEQEQKRMNRDPDYDADNPGLLTGPDYWPSQDDWKAKLGHEPTGCRHREPDHIFKHERINLTIHFLHAGDRFKDAKFGLEKLRDATKTVTHDHPKEFQPGAQQLIEAFFYAREQEIRYENGEIDGDTIIYVPMPAEDPGRPKRKPRSKKQVIKAKELTPETSTFFELGTPINPSPSAHSSFTSVFNNTLKVESESSSPLHSAGLSRVNDFGADLHTPMKRLASQTSSYPSTSASEDFGPTLSNRTTPAPSEGDTEADSLNGVICSGGPLEQAESDNLTLVTGSQPTSQHMSNLNDVAKTIIGDLPMSAAQEVSNFSHGLHSSNVHGSEPYAISTTERRATEDIYVSPTDTYIHAWDNNLLRPDYTANVSNTTHSLIPSAPTRYFPPLSPCENRPVAPPPSPMATHSMPPNLFLTSVPSDANPFSNSMLMNPGWHSASLADPSLQTCPCLPHLHPQQQQYRQIDPSLLLPPPTMSRPEDVYASYQQRVWHNSNPNSGITTPTGSFDAMRFPATMQQQQEGEDGLVSRTSNTGTGRAAGLGSG